MSETSKRRANNTPPATLDEVLEAYVMSDAGPSLAALTDWVRQFPDFEEELTSLTAEWALATHLPDVQDPNEPDTEMLVLRGMSVVYSLLHERRRLGSAEAGRPAPAKPGPDLPVVDDRQAPPKSPARAEVPSVRHRRRDGGEEDSDSYARSPSDHTERSTPIRGLLTEGIRHGFTPEGLASATGLSVPLLRKLDRRVIPADTIPNAVTERLASALRRDPPVILDYSRLPPRFAPSAEHRSSQAPQLPTKLEGFFDAVRADPELSDEQRKALLAFEVSNTLPERAEGDG
jgi:hypothetical protein